MTSGGEQIVAGRIVTVPLDANGLVAGVVLVWPNSDLTPADTVYIVKAFTAVGQFVWEGQIAITPLGSDLLLQEDGFFFILEDGSGFIALEV